MIGSSGGDDASEKMGYAAERPRVQCVQAKATLSRVRVPNRSDERATAFPPSAR
jgi:hypothetical protein